MLVEEDLLSTISASGCLVAFFDCLYDDDELF